MIGWVQLKATFPENLTLDVLWIAILIGILGWLLLVAIPDESNEVIILLLSLQHILHFNIKLIPNSFLYNLRQHPLPLLLLHPRLFFSLAQEIGIQELVEIRR